MEKFNVQKIEFENNKSIEELCEVADTEPDPGRETGDIVSIEKQGYTRQGHLIRPAEVVIVKIRNHYHVPIQEKRQHRKVCSCLPA